MIVTSAGYLGDIRLGGTLDAKFSTSRFSSGASFTLAGSPAVSAYVDNGTTEITSGVTLTVDFDGLTGLHNVRVVASGGNGFATATNVTLVITAGTVDGVSVVGVVVGSFSIENRQPPSALSLTSLTITPASGGGDAVTITGGAASGATPAGHGINVTGGAASTTGGGTAGVGIRSFGGAGAASNNGPGNGVTFSAGGVTTVAGGIGCEMIGTGSFSFGLQAKVTGGGYGGRFLGGPDVGGGLNLNGGSSANGDGCLVGGVGDGPALILLGQTGHAVTVSTGDGGDGVVIHGGDANGSTPAGQAVRLVGGAASTTSGGTAGVGMSITGGPGAATVNGAAAGFTIAAGSTVTVSGNTGVTIAGTGTATGMSITGGGSNSLSIGGSGAAVDINYLSGVGFRILGASSGTHAFQLSPTANNNCFNLSFSGSGHGFSTDAIDRNAFAADTGLRTLLSGTATAGSANTITIATHATAQYWRFRTVKLTGGTGEGQDGWIIDYDNGTGVATILGNWLVNPNGTTTYAILDSLPWFTGGQIVF